MGYIQNFGLIVVEIFEFMLLTLLYKQTIFCTDVAGGSQYLSVKIFYIIFVMCNWNVVQGQSIWQKNAKMATLMLNISWIWSEKNGSKEDRTLLCTFCNFSFSFFIYSLLPSFLSQNVHFKTFYQKLIAIMFSWDLNVSKTINWNCNGLMKT